MVIRKLNKHGERNDEKNENINKLENTKKTSFTAKKYNKWNKNILEGIKNKLGDIEECISNLKRRI